jgi:hypothetical protein
MNSKQGPLAAKTLDEKVVAAGWHKLPSWFVVATEDQIVSPDLQRSLAKRAGSKIVEIAGSHAVLVSRAHEVAKVIESAAHTAAQ